MKNHKGKIIAAVVITAIILFFLIVYGAAVMNVVKTEPLTLVFIFVLALLGAGMVVVLIERIREIRKGEEDDLSNY